MVVIQKKPEIQGETQVRACIEQNLNEFAGRGVPRRHGDTNTYLRFWQMLSLEEKQLFETLLEEGNFAGSAAEIVAIASGREIPHGNGGV